MISCVSGTLVAVGMFVVAAATPGEASPQSPAATAQRKISAGREMAQTYCSGCHAIGKTGRSSHPDAPPFRTLSESYPIDSLAEAFAEGISVGHPDMPEWQFQPPQIDNLLAYLKSVQAPRSNQVKTPMKAASAASEKEVADLAAQGFALAQARCASCHAVAADQRTSPRPNAPSFQMIANLPGLTPMALNAWLYSSHQTMPLITVDAADRNRLFSYLDSLRRGRSKS